MLSYSTDKVSTLPPRFRNTIMSNTSVENHHHSTSLSSKTILTKILGTNDLHEILSDRVRISGAMMKVELLTRSYITPQLRCWTKPQSLGESR